MTQQTQAVARPIGALQKALSAESVRQQFDNCLSENAGAFIASIIDLVGSNPGLQQCDSNAVIRECLKAATLKLPINSQLGFAWIIPYKVKGVPTPQFQIGYKGLVQLAMRTGQYKVLNADLIYEGEDIKLDRLTGKVEISGEATSEKPLGYFAHMELINGFTKTLYMTNETIVNHGKRFSKTWSVPNSAWQTDFDAMALKTVLRRLLSKWGYLSIEMANVLDKVEEPDAEYSLEQEKEHFANQEIIDTGNGTENSGNGTGQIVPVDEEVGPAF
ncbi:recombinase RecT [Chloroflexota bacterium]